jgi:hypothetical protein
MSAAHLLVNLPNSSVPATVSMYRELGKTSGRIDSVAGARPHPRRRGPAGSPRRSRLCRPGRPARGRPADRLPRPGAGSDPYASWRWAFLAVMVLALVATVIGMFAYLGTAYPTGIRLSAVQGCTPLRTSIAFVLLDVMTLLMVPFDARVLERYSPRSTWGWASRWSAWVTSGWPRSRCPTCRWRRWWRRQIGPARGERGARLDRRRRQGGPVQPVAFDALGSAYARGYVIRGWRRWWPPCSPPWSRAAARTSR